MKTKLLLTLVVLLFAVAAWGDTHTFTANAVIGCNDLTYEGFDITVSGCVLTVDCLHHFNSLSVINGGSVTHAAGDTNGLYLNVATDVTINTGCSIQADGRGYAPGTGPGAGTSWGGYGGGGAYGGNGGDGGGGQTGGAAYGDLAAPVDMGSGGGGTSGPGSGGGAVHLVVTNALLVNGTLSANGISTTSISAGGAGGSVYVQCGSLTGNGSISASGGSGHTSYSGGGSGGRIALYYTANSFSGTITACGGNGLNVYGGAGTIYTKAAAASLGNLSISNCGQSPTMTPLSALPACNVSITSSARVLSAASLTVSGLLRIGTGSEVWAPAGVAITISAASATIDSAGKLLADGCGYAPGAGPGAGTSWGGYGGGGAYGGNGGDGGGGQTGGVAYGDLAAPVDMGSGGGGTSGPGSGGGAVHLVVTNALLVNGTLSANGISTTNISAGGAGGGIYVQCASIAGNGSISANGGSGHTSYSGGGSGGRIALYYTANSFSGTITACGGNGLNVYGGAGTIYTKAAAASLGNLSVSNCGQFPTMTPLSALPACNVSITSSARVLSAASLTVSGLLRIGTGSEVWAPAGIAITISAASATIDSAGKLLADGCGYTPGAGPGAGTSWGGYGGGGAYGGNGGGGGGGTMGGLQYDVVAWPSYMGSGGGGTSGPGAGGGAVRLVVTNSLLVNGTLSANGISTTGISGGGAGGSILIKCAGIGGNGSISANGGSGHTSYSGGGGGGRVAFYYCSGSFPTDSVMVNGGIGIIAGAAGTISWGDADLNLNGIHDGCDIQNGTSTDCNHNGIPDEVEISGNATTVTVEFNNTSTLLLRWPCIVGYDTYHLYGKQGNTTEVLLGTVSGGVYDATYLLSGSDPQKWVFRVNGVH